jgi:hypothetical protein
MRSSVSRQAVKQRSGFREIIVERRGIEPKVEKNTIEPEAEKDWTPLGKIALEIANSIRFTGRLPRDCRLANGKE